MKNLLGLGGGGEDMHFLYEDLRENKTADASIAYRQWIKVPKR